MVFLDVEDFGDLHGVVVATEFGDVRDELTIQGVFLTGLVFLDFRSRILSDRERAVDVLTSLPSLLSLKPLGMAMGRVIRPPQADIRERLARYACA